MTTTLPHRNTGGSVTDDEAVPDTDPSDVSHSAITSLMNEATLTSQPDIQLAP